MNIFNSMSRKKEEFIPVHEGKVGIYACGPTVYDYFHIGNARPFITFDVLRRQLEREGYNVTFVQNFTDIDDKMIRRANEEGITVKELADRFIGEYYTDARALGIHPATVHPRATEHISEIITLISRLIENGHAYAVPSGDVYYRVSAFPGYGKLSGQNIEDREMGASERLNVETDKENPADFALWKKASPEHIMRWPSPWSVGFPGWHTECTAMGTKYLGEMFDIHGGGMDLMFPHHESEIAQKFACCGHGPCKYWMHNNMITINGQKMGKSLGNFITLDEFFTGNHKLLEQAYTPMTIRFFILQAHYRSTVDFSNEALVAAEKGYNRLMQAYKTLQRLQPAKSSSVEVKEYRQKCYDAMNDDLNTPIVISHLFDMAKLINTVNDRKATLTQADIDELKGVMETFAFEVMGLRDEASTDNTALIDGLMKMILDMRATAKANKDWATSDKIRDALGALGVTVKDGKDGATYEL